MDKKFKVVYVKSIDSENKQISAYVSTYDWDRMDERFEKGAWKLENFTANPVVLWVHDYSSTPIAKAIEISEDDFGLLSVMQFDKESDRAMEIFSLYQRGFLNAFSVGFIPKAHLEETIPGTEKTGWIWTSAELLEYSAVPVPANPKARVQRELAEMITKTLGSSFLPENGIEIEDKGRTDIDELEVTLKNLIELCKVAKQENLVEKKIELIRIAISTLNDLALQNKDFVSASELGELNKTIDMLADIIKSDQPDAQDLVSRFMTQFTNALNKR